MLFATHYLAEADEQADRVVLNRGRVVADGSAAEVKSVVSSRLVSATLPAADAGRLRLLPGVDDVTVHGSTVQLRCSDSDAALRALLAAYPRAEHPEVTGADLTAAFLTLTGGADE